MGTHETPEGRLPLTRRTTLSAIAGIGLGTALPLGSRTVAAEEYAAQRTSTRLTPRPTETSTGGTESLNGTWEFTLAGSTTPPTSSSNQVVPDHSSAGNDGTVANDPPMVDDSENQGLDLSGDGSVTVPSNDGLDFSDLGFTLQARIRYDGGSGLVLDKGSSAVSAGTEQFGLGVYDGTLSFYMQGSDGSYPDSLGTSIATGEWHTVTVVVDAGENRLFVDGERIGAVSHGVDGLASSDAPLVVGGNGLDFAVASTAAFDGALTADEIENGFSSVPDSAVLWFTYDDLEEQTADWATESVPGQWAYDDYFVPNGAADWYPPEGQVGWYRREFEVPDGWADGRLKLRFDGVYSRARVYLNGTQVADHVGGYTPFEVDIVDAVDPDGTNTLAVGVSQRSKSDDMSWQNVTGGITRDVTLLSVPDVHLSESYVHTSLDDGSGTVTVDATVTNAGEAASSDGTVTVDLADDGSTVGSAETSVPSLPAGDSTDVSVDVRVSNPKTWNPEQPRLYTATVEFTTGSTTERLTERVGIREVEVVGNELRINDTPVTLRGINWEEVHLPKYDQAIPAEITRQDARRLKEANVNYVRTCHHPTSEAFLDACDELGIVVEMEAPHMFIGRDRGDPYPEIVVQQTLEMVERDRNRTSVCIWSIANESNWYDCFDAAADLVDDRDPTRPTIFNHDDYDPNDPWHDEFDIRADHYPALRNGSTVAEHTGLEDPILFDEFAHTYCYDDRELVTDPGLRDEWGRVFETIWGQCRTAESVAGAALWAGGDHLEQWGEYLWGIVDRNRRHRPEFWHVTKVYAPVVFGEPTWKNDHRVTIPVENRHEFVDLAERTLTWDDGKRTEEVDLSLAPGETTTITRSVRGDAAELTVTDPDGRLLNRFRATPDPEPTALPEDPNGAAMTTADGALAAETDAFSVAVDSDTGEVDLSLPDGTRVVEGLELALTPTQEYAGRDYETIIDHRRSGHKVTDVRRTGDSSVAIDVAYDAANGTFEVRFYEDRLIVDYEFSLASAMDVREAGVALVGTEDLRTLSWNRDGLWSTYPTDHIGRRVGTAPAFPDGSRPDHEGIVLGTEEPWKDDATSHGSNDFRSTKRNVRRAALTDASGDGVRVVSDGDQHVRAQVRDGSTDLLVLDRSISGTNPNGWMDRQPVLDQDSTLDAGETVDGSVTIQLTSDDAAIAQVNPSTTDATVGERVSFRVNDTSGDDRWIESLRWDLGDGATDSGWYTAHRFDAPGSYTVTLTATDQNGATTTADVVVTVSELSESLARIRPSTTTATAGQRVTFQVEDATGNDRWIESLDWVFGDGTTGSGWWVAHQYDATGTYTVELTATDNTGHSTTTTVEIDVNS